MVSQRVDMQHSKARSALTQVHADGFVPLTAKDVADNVIYAATRPANVQIGEVGCL